MTTNIRPVPGRRNVQAMRGRHPVVRDGHKHTVPAAPPTTGGRRRCEWSLRLPARGCLLFLGLVCARKSAGASVTNTPPPPPPVCNRCFGKFVLGSFPDPQAALRPAREWHEVRSTYSNTSTMTYKMFLHQASRFVATT